MNKLLSTFTLFLLLLTACTPPLKNNRTSNAEGGEKTEENTNMDKIKTTISTDKQIYAQEEAVLLSFEVSNTGKTPFTFLPWQTPLEKHLTGDCMNITRNETSVSYTGIMVKRRPPTEEDYLTLQSGKSTSGEINLLDSYQLTEKGTYIIQFKESYQNLPASNEVEIEVE